MTARKAVEEAEPERILTPEEELEMLRQEVAELKAKVVVQDTALDELKKKEEGWLIICNNPLYQGTTLDVLFTDGMAFIPKNRIYKRFLYDPLTEDQKQAIMDDKVRHPHPEKEIAMYEASIAIPSSERLVINLTRDFGYKAEFFTKDQMDELQKKMTLRAQERREAQAKLEKEPTFLERLSIPQRM